MESAKFAAEFYAVYQEVNLIVPEKQNGTSALQFGRVIFYDGKVNGRV